MHKVCQVIYTFDIYIPYILKNKNLICNTNINCTINYTHWILFIYSLRHEKQLYIYSKSYEMLPVNLL